MTLFEQFLVVYFISAAALAGFAVLWRNWLEDHAHWKRWMGDHLGVIGKALMCGSCFTYWLTLLFVLIFNPLGPFLASLPAFENLWWPVSYGIQWMALGWGAVAMRFGYVALQEGVSIMVHRHDGRHRA